MMREEDEVGLGSIARALNTTGGFSFLLLANLKVVVDVG